MALAHVPARSLIWAGIVAFVQPPSRPAVRFLAEDNDPGHLGDRAHAWLPPKKRHLLESQASQNLLHPRVGQRPDPFTQASLVDRSDLRHDHDTLLGKVALA